MQDHTILNKLRKFLTPTKTRRIPSKIKIVTLTHKESRRINKLLRKKNHPTNVLSFRYGPDYGEILLCPEVIKKEAKTAGNSYKYQFAWMVLHGMLHLAGLHHERSKKVNARVEKLEQEILDKLFKIRK